MALVKTTALTGKGVRVTVPSEARERVPFMGTQATSQRRAQARLRARQEKAAERIGAATEQLAAGVAEASASAV